VLTVEATKLGVRATSLPEVENVCLDVPDILHNLPAEVPVCKAPAAAA
jgi:hypothetical protein